MTNRSIGNIQQLAEAEVSTALLRRVRRLRQADTGIQTVRCANEKEAGAAIDGVLQEERKSAGTTVSPQSRKRWRSCTMNG